MFVYYCVCYFFYRYYSIFSHSNRAVFSISCLTFLKWKDVTPHANLVLPAFLPFLHRFYEAPLITICLNPNLGGLFWSGRERTQNYPICLKLPDLSKTLVIIMLETWNLVGNLASKYTHINYTTCLKLVRIMLETWKLVVKCTHIFCFRKYTF